MCPYVAGIEQELFNGACVPKYPSGATRDVSGVCQCPADELVWGASTDDEGQFTAGVCHMLVKVQMPRDNVQLKLQYLQHVQMVAIQVPENVFYQDHHVQQAVF